MQEFEARTSQRSADCSFSRSSMISLASSICDSHKMNRILEFLLPTHQSGRPDAALVTIGRWDEQAPLGESIGCRILLEDSHSACSSLFRSYMVQLLVQRHCLARGFLLLRSPRRISSAATYASSSAVEYWPPRT